MKKVIDLSLLRQMIAELQKDGFIEITIYDLLTYIIPVSHSKEEENGSNET